LNERKFSTANVTMRPLYEPHGALSMTKIVIAGG
jgi:hypothetical protein